MLVVREPIRSAGPSFLVGRYAKEDRVRLVGWMDARRGCWTDLVCARIPVLDDGAWPSVSRDADIWRAVSNRDSGKVNLLSALLIRANRSAWYATAFHNHNAPRKTDSALLRSAGLRATYASIPILANQSTATTNTNDRLYSAKTPKNWSFVNGSGTTDLYLPRCRHAVRRSVASKLKCLQFRQSARIAGRDNRNDVPLRRFAFEMRAVEHHDW
jgi:hypothetical protein